MRTTAAVAVVVAALRGLSAAQEKKPVPKDSARLTIPGCTKGYIFTAARRTEDEPASADVPEGMRRLHARYRLAPVSNGNISIMVDLARHNGFSWDTVLGAEIAKQPEPYYDAWLRALEALLRKKAIATDDEIDVLAAAWHRAAHATPHGKPILLENDPEFGR